MRFYLVFATALLTVGVFMTIVTHVSNLAVAAGLCFLLGVVAIVAISIIFNLEFEDDFY